jgi:hypothetical protein
MDVKELAADMRPATGLDDPSSREQSVEAGVSVGVQHTGEPLEVISRVLSFAVGRVAEECRWRPDAVKRPLVPDVGPQPTRFGPAAARRQ